MQPMDADQTQLVTQNLPLIGYHVSEMLMRVPNHVSRDDLASAGALALVQAARAYDATTGVPFNRYASIRIKGSMVDELRSMDWVTRGARQRARQFTTVADELTANLGRAPSRDEVAAALGVEVSEVDTARQHAATRVLSLEGYDGALAEVLPARGIGPEESVIVDERLRYLTAAVETLPERLRTVVEQVFFHDRSVTDIAKDLGVTQSRVSQLRAEAMLLLRDGMNTHLDPAMVPTPAQPDGVAQRRRETYFSAIAERAAHSSSSVALAGMTVAGALRDGSGAPGGHAGLVAVG
ncbi:RNA polymerase sigma factor for flagellar operon FliA [Sanguibacter gelidistatuariae]|uniref:RNA polymerase sigma factor for flagellar operon FliA n=1 Tax=Sanguibacter gelidistatuariae TaxID=1814289 RepID=A0A1G6PV26_9MICO|nr:sigma-70 family RNA polymerase sigma factor [Sanguibacter gelidistatuariae]SDC84070.1 RNA polymerase sigma factor for flagellar operon FliA [Sanguibacter gelidistatuariae]